jgi:hypothetical protein
MIARTGGDRLLAALSSLSPRQWDQLEQLLEDPTRRRALRNIIESVIDIQNGVSLHEVRAPSDRHDLEAIQTVTEAFRDEDSVRQSFFSLLCDKKIFRTTRDVISAINHFFDVHLETARFIKAGRKDAIVEAWKRLTARPRREQIGRLRTFFENFAGRLDPHKSYRELFRILSRSE